MFDYRSKIVSIKEKLSSLNETYFEELCLADRQQIIEITEYCNSFLFSPEKIDLLDSMLIELNDLSSYNKVDKRRRYLFRATITDIVRHIKDILEE